MGTNVDSTNRQRRQRWTTAEKLRLVQERLRRIALIVALEEFFGRVQIFGSELAFAKYCRNEWPDERINQVVAGIINKRGLKLRLCPTASGTAYRG
jgi:hypothetical protein